MNSILIVEKDELAPASQNVTHYVEAVDSKHSWCGVDVTKAKWGKGLEAPICEECDFRWKNCNCKLCMEARVNNV